MYHLTPEQEAMVARARALARSVAAEHAGAVDADVAVPAGSD